MMLTNTLYLIHDSVLWVFALNDGRFHKVTFRVITVAPSYDSQVRGGLGMVQPLLYTAERLQEKREDEKLLEICYGP